MGLLSTPPGAARYNGGNRSFYLQTWLPPMPTPGDRFNHLVEIMRTLRSPGGCPWDREQTLASLRPFLLEETYEALEAIDRGDMADLQEELGDLVFEVVFMAQICAEAGAFTVTDAIDTIATKLVRRHPHVFGGADRAHTADEVLGRWEDLKRDERAATGAAPKATLGGVPRTLPGLLRAYEYGSRAASVGFDWSRAADVLDKIEEEVRELREAVARAGTDAGRADTHAGGAASGSAAPTRHNETAAGAAVEEEMGDLLFAIANLSRKLGVEPENALRRANDKFAARFTALEARVAARGASMKAMPLEELEEEWQGVKRRET
jgi:MazG family protein